MGLVGNGSDFDPFYGGLVRKGGPREKRVYRVALMNEYASQRNNDKPDLSKEDVHDYLERQRRVAQPIKPFKIPPANKATIVNDEMGNLSVTTPGSPVLRSASPVRNTTGHGETRTMSPSQSATRGPRLGGVMDTSVDAPPNFQDTRFLDTAQGRLEGSTSTTSVLMDDERHPTQHIYEPIQEIVREDVSDRSPFHRVRPGGPKQKRIFKVALMGEFNKPPGQERLSKGEVDEWVTRSREENERKKPIIDDHDFDPFFRVRRGGPKEKRLYRTSMMGEYDYHREVDNTQLLEVLKEKQPLTLEMPPMPGFEPFDGVREGGPKEVRLYKRALMGEYDYRKARDETALERIRREREEKKLASTRK